MRHSIILSAIVTALTVPAVMAAAQPAAPAAAPVAPAAAYSTATTPIGTLLDDPQARAVVDSVMPGFSASDQIAMARPMTLKAIQAFAPDKITDDILAKIDAGLAKLPPAK